MIAAPPIGSRWQHVAGCVFEYLGTRGDDPTYCHAVKLVEKPKLHPTPIGHVSIVELPWFVHAAKEIK